MAMASSHLLLALQQSSSSLRHLLSPPRLHYSSYPSTFSTCSGRSFSCVVASEQTSCRSSSSSSSSSCIAAAAAVGECDGEEQQEVEVPEIISRNQFKLTPRSRSSRRRILLSSSTGTVAVAAFLLASGSTSPPSANARDRRNRKEIPVEDFQTSDDGLKFYDINPGGGPVAEKGETVVPYEFIVGSTPGKERKREFVDNANGLYSAQASPKPPPALYTITEGMRVGGKRTVIVPPEAGYGSKGMNEIPPDATFELNVELLELKKMPSS
ncbi:hypothetical protein CY35_04G039100 [Sphagnum magellanicum]|nr:hypothetical protein CY35_04G039100 [Sphagnum magellanicum]